MVETLKVVLRLLGQRSFEQKLLEQVRSLRRRILAFTATLRIGIHNQFIYAECFYVEEDLRPQTMRAIEILVEVFRIGRDTNSEFFDKRLGNGAVWSGALNRKRATESEAKCMVHA